MGSWSLSCQLLQHSVIDEVEIHHGPESRLPGDRPEGQFFEPLPRMKNIVYHKMLLFLYNKKTIIVIMSKCCYVEICSLLRNCVISLYHIA